MKYPFALLTLYLNSLIIMFSCSSAYELKSFSTPYDVKPVNILSPYIMPSYKTVLSSMMSRLTVFQRSITPESYRR